MIRIAIHHHHNGEDREDRGTPLNLVGQKGGSRKKFLGKIYDDTADMEALSMKKVRRWCVCVLGRVCSATEDSTESISRSSPP